MAAALLAAATGAQAQSVPADEKLLVSADELKALSADRILRIEANLAGAIGTWTGVRGCSDRNRVRNELVAGFERWVGQQVNAHAGQLVLRNGWNTAAYKYYNGRKPWPSRARYCRGNFRSVAVFIEFRIN